MSLLVSYEPAFETRRSLQRSFQRRLLFFCIFVCSDFFFAFFLVLDFFFNVSMDFSFDETREEMQKKIFYSWPQQTFFQLFFFLFLFHHQHQHVPITHRNYVKLSQYIISLIYITMF